MPTVPKGTRHDYVSFRCVDPKPIPFPHDSSILPFTARYNIARFQPASMSFQHPSSNKKKKISSPLNNSWNLLKSLRFIRTVSTEYQTKILYNSHWFILIVTLSSRLQLFTPFAGKELPVRRSRSEWSKRKPDLLRPLFVQFVTIKASGEGVWGGLESGGDAEVCATTTGKPKNSRWRCSR